MPDSEPSTVAADGRSASRHHTVIGRLRSPEQAADVRRLPGPGRAGPRDHAGPAQPGVVSDDTKTYLYLDPGRTSARRPPSGTRASHSGRSPTRTSGTCCPWDPSTGSWPSCTSRSGWPSGSGWPACSSRPAQARSTSAGSWASPVPAGTWPPWRLHVHPLRAPVRGPDLGHPHAVGRAPMDAGLRDPRPPHGRLAVPGALRPGGGPGQRHQRQLDPLRRHRPGALAPLRGAGDQEATWRQAWGVAWKVGLLTALVSLWWAVGLQVEAAYGVNVLKYTETVPATSCGLSGLGDHARPRLLVLLRLRPGRALDPDIRWRTPRTSG